MLSLKEAYQFGTIMVSVYRLGEESTRVNSQWSKAAYKAIHVPTHSWGKGEQYEIG